MSLHIIQLFHLLDVRPELCKINDLIRISLRVGSVNQTCWFQCVSMKLFGLQRVKKRTKHDFYFSTQLSNTYTIEIDAKITFIGKEGKLGTRNIYIII